VPSSLHVLGAFGAGLAALIVTRLVDGRSGLRDIGARLRWTGVGGTWRLLAIASPFGLLAISLLVVRAIRGVWPPSALLTPIWAAWHLPLFFFIDGYQAMAAWAIVGWLASVFVGAILMTWLYNSSRGSLPVVAIFHGTLDIVFNSPSAGDLPLVLGVLVTLWGLGILALRGPRNLATIPRQIEHAWPGEQRWGAG